MEHAHATPSFMGFEPHGHCFLWQPDLIALHTVSDFVTGLSYYLIPFLIFYFVRKRSDVPFPAMFLLFALFIISCGTTHFMAIWTTWTPDYWAEGWVKAATAFFSLLTAIMLFPLLPKAMLIPSPAQLEEANRQLESEIVFRRQAEAELKQHKDHLEDLVAERTAELQAANHRLESEMAERKAFAEALRKSEERFREFIEGTDNIVTQTGPDGRFTYVNKVAAALFGHTQEECVGKLAFDSVMPEERQRTIEAFDGWISGRIEKTTFENHQISATGDVRALVWNIHLHYDGGVLAYVNSIAQDITELSRAQRQLHESREFLENIIDNIPDPIFVKDKEHRFILVNTTLCQLTGRGRDEVLGKTDRDFFSKDQTDVFWARDDHVINTGEVDISEEQVSSSPEQILTVVTKKNRYVDTGGREYIVGIIRDVTERKHMQEIMVQTEKMMSVGGLAAGMAHEINNPLSAIMQSIQVIQNRLSKENDANRDAAEKVGCTFSGIKDFMEARSVFALLQGVRDAGTRAAKIVSSMLEFSRKSESHRAPTDINDLLDKAVELCSNDYDLKKNYDFRKIVIERDFDPHIALVPCTATQIEQVVMNLLRNAAQAMTWQPGEAVAPRIVLRTKQEGSTVRIEVEDNGPGMTEDVRKRIFEPFYTTKVPGQGTGLGLSVSYFIITENHKGTVEVESQPGKGSRFIIRLPLSWDATSQ